MNTYYDEATRYQENDSEATQFADAMPQQTDNNNAAPANHAAKEVKASKGSTWKNAAAGAGSGLLIGGLATVLMGMKGADSNDSADDTEGGNHANELSHPEWVDDEVAVATTVNDDMSFGEAFAAARADVGSGGCFEWHGNLYSTYTAEEWDSMTAEQRAEWSNHFSWNHIDHSSSDVAQNSSNQSASTDQSATVQDQETADNDDIAVVSVDPQDNNLAQSTSTQTSDQNEWMEVSQDDPEIEILGVVHDNETGANIGGMTLDGQEVILVDVDNDLTFDYLATDADGNGQLSQDEIIDIQDQNLTVNDLGGFDNPMDDLYANNDGPDYTTDGFDGVYEG